LKESELTEEEKGKKLREISTGTGELYSVMKEQ